MTFLEKNLEDIIFETDNGLLQERGLFIKGQKKRQVRIGNYGIADIITLDRECDVVEEHTYQRIAFNVFELKQHKVDANTLMQAYRYCRGIQRYMYQKYPKLYNRIKYNAVLIGREISQGDFCYLMGFFDSLTVYTYKYDFDGIQFEQHGGFILKEEGFGG